MLQLCQSMFCIRRSSLRQFSYRYLLNNKIRNTYDFEVSVPDRKSAPTWLSKPIYSTCSCALYGLISDGLAVLVKHLKLCYTIERRVFERMQNSSLRLSTRIGHRLPGTDFLAQKGTRNRRKHTSYQTGPIMAATLHQPQINLQFRRQFPQLPSKQPPDYPQLSVQFITFIGSGRCINMTDTTDSNKEDGVIRCYFIIIYTTSHL